MRKRKKELNWLLLLSLVPLVYWGCNTLETSPLPILGPYHRIGGVKQMYRAESFALDNQSGGLTASKDLADKVKVIDFFFTSCPSICPKVQAQMLRIQDHFAANPRLQLLSFSVDPKRDTPIKLAEYAHNIGADTVHWTFLTGDRDVIFGLADDFFNIVTEDPSAPGGIDHTGRIVLLDKQGYIRAYANGVNTASVDTFLLDIQQLLDDEF